MNDTPVCVNGAYTNLIPISDRGLSYGDGLFETVRISSGRPTLENYHWQRLQLSCDNLGVKVDKALLYQEINSFLVDQQAHTGVLKIIITRGSGGRGYNPDGCLDSRRILSLHPLPKRQPDPSIVGARVKKCHRRLGKSSIAGIKHLNRLEQVLARSEWQHNEYDEGLLYDFDGNLIEGTMSNLFAVTHDGELITPDLSYSGVKGVCREFIFDLAQQKKIPVKEQQIISDSGFSEFFLCNSVYGVWPIISYEHREWEIGPVTTLIRDSVMEELNA